MRLRVGLVGLGEAWQLRHRAALLALRDRFEVRAVCDQVAERAAQAAADFGATAVDGFRTLAERSDIDAVMVLSAEWYGPLPILAACEAGKAVYAAAALDIEPDRASEIKQRVLSSGVAFMVELPRRHAPATLRLKELIATHLGRPRLLFCHSRRELGPRNGRLPGGRRCPTTVRDMLELIDWCRYVVDVEPTSVNGATHMGLTGDQDYQMLSLDFSDPSAPDTGALAQISCSRYLRAAWHEAISFRPPAELQVCCERGIAFVDLPSTLTWFDDAGRHLESLGSERTVGEQMLMQFHRSVTSLVRKRGDLEDAHRALQIVMAAEESRIQGCRVSLVF